MCATYSLVSENICKKLIQQVKSREYLWNPDHENYSARSQTSKAWLEIAGELDVNESKLRAKWKNLRDIFKKELKRVDDDGFYCGKWRFFSQLMFLNSTNEQNSDKNTTKSGENVIVDHFVDLEYLEEDQFKKERPEDDIETLDENIETFLEDPREDPIATRRKMNAEDDDYDVMFLKSLAPYFKELDPIRKLVVRSKMQDLLLNEIAAQTTCRNTNGAKRKKQQ